MYLKKYIYLQICCNNVSIIANEIMYAICSGVHLYKITIK